MRVIDALKDLKATSPRQAIVVQCGDASRLPRAAAVGVVTMIRER